MSKRLLSRHVQPRLSEARLARQWREAERLAGRRRAPRRVAGLLALGIAFTAMLAWGLHAHRRLAPSPIEGAILEAGHVVLPDGAQIAVDAGGRVRIDAVSADRIELGLLTGALDLAVVHGPRRVVVHAGAYDVVDLGTRFRVALDEAGAVRVDVTEGSVQVEEHVPNGRVFPVVAGGTWSSAPPVTTAPRASEGGASAPAEEPASDDVEPRVGAGPSTPGPRRLLERAERERLAGDPRAAAAALDTLRRVYRHDARAALAAFELGRLRLDVLHDLPGAVEALTDAIRLAPKGPLREDAEARRVEALAAERSPKCAAARDAFLERYPGGVHRAAVAGQCGAD